MTINIDGGVGSASLKVPSSAVAPSISREQTGHAAVTINSTGSANIIGNIDLDSTAATITSVTINAETSLNARLSEDDYAADAVLTLKGNGAIDLQRASLSASITKIDATGAAGG